MLHRQVTGAEVLAVDGASLCSKSMLEEGRPWNLEALPGSRVVMVLAHPGKWDAVQLSIANQQLRATAQATVEQTQLMTQPLALQMLRLLEPAYSTPSTVYPELTQQERHTTTLQVSLQGKVRWMLQQRGVT